MSDCINWGILGPGRISRQFAAALGEARGAEIVAVGSRDLPRAEAFAADFGIPRAYGNYADLAADPAVQAIYIGTPHAFHAEQAVMCLEAGKHVLCEKAFALNRAQGERMAAAARSNDRLLMEAMWTRFLPVVAEVRQQIAAGAIGVPRVFTADFGFRSPFDPDSRLYAPDLGGGALLDLGVYPVAMAVMLFGGPVDVQAQAQLAATGVDEDLIVQMLHEAGALTQFRVCFTADTPKQAMVTGTEGALLLHTPWWGGEQLTRIDGDGTRTDFARPHRGDGYTHQAEAFMDLVRAGQRDSDLMPLAESLEILGIMDDIRGQCGIRYPGE